VSNKSRTYFEASPLLNEGCGRGIPGGVCPRGSGTGFIRCRRMVPVVLQERNVVLPGTGTVTSDIPDIPDIQSFPTVSSSSGPVNLPPARMFCVGECPGFQGGKGGSGMTITAPNLASEHSLFVIPLSWVGSLCLVAHYFNSVPRQKWPPGGSQVVDIPISRCAY